MSNKIKQVESYVVRPNRHNLVVVKVLLENGDFGYGCATFQQRPFVVKEMIDRYMAPVIIGKDASNIEDIWNLLHVNGYWRNGPITNNAISGIDMALWDIKAKQAKMPLYQLFGGKSRNKIAAYTYAEGDSAEIVIEKIHQLVGEGYTHIRCQLGLYGGTIETLEEGRGQLGGEYYNPKEYMYKTIELFREIRKEFGNSIELIHDVHERVDPQQAVQFAKKMEEFDLFFFEDPIAPEQLHWLKRIKEQTATPIGIGELFNNQNEWKQYIVNGEIDYIRCHVSQIGGITPALKVMALCNLFGVNVAWHGPSDMSPIGVAVNTHLGIYGQNVRVQEYAHLDEYTKKMFPGAVEVNKGYIHPIEEIGIGVGFDESLVDEFKPIYREHEWTQSRTPDGTIHTP